MGDVVEFPKVTSEVPLRGLTRQECADVKTAADTLIEQGQATGSSIHRDGQYSIHNDGQYMCVFGPGGTPFMISRQNGFYYLLDNDEMILTRSQRFEIVLQSLEAALASPEDELA